MKIPSIADGSTDPIARLIRRICLLRERGDEAEAGKIEGEQLASAIRDFRLEHGPEALPDLALKNIFAAEKERAAEAAMLAELLLPQLLGQWSAPRLAPVEAFAPNAPSAPQPAPTAAHAPASGAGPPAIPDLLDAMLAYESTSRRRDSAKLSSRRP